MQEGSSLGSGDLGRVERRLREELVRAGKLLHESGLVGGSGGNISARISGTDRVLIKPHGVNMGQLSPEDLVLIDINGNVIREGEKPSDETPMHTAIYRARSHSGAVAHTHPVFATSLGIMGKQLLPLAVEGVFSIAKGVPIVPFLLPGSEELARAVVSALGGNKDAVILKNHGLVVLGSTMGRAATASVLIERSARMQFICELIGTPEPVPRKALDEMFRRFGRVR